MKKLFFSFLILFFSLNSLAEIQMYGAGIIGYSKASETSAGNTYNHTNSFFIGHLGYGAGVRLGIKLGVFFIGGVGDLSWVGDSFDRKQVGVVNDSTYRYESIRTILGASTALHLGSFFLLGEYYPSVQNTVSYSDDKAQNPFRKNDQLKATGYGAGFGYDFGSGLSMNITYRSLAYRDVEMNGTLVSLPNSQYSNFVFSEFAFGPAYTF